MSKKRKRTSPSEGGLDTCWLCEEEEGECIKVWRQHPLHMKCFNAIRCHQRLLHTTEEKEQDKDLFVIDPAGWKAGVLGLVVDKPGSRDLGARQLHRAEIAERTSYQDKSQILDDLLLTKARFKSYTKFWDGYNSDSASESWERRHDETDSDHENHRGEAQVRVQDNSRLRDQTGRRTSLRERQAQPRGRAVERDRRGRGERKLSTPPDRSSGSRRSHREEEPRSGSKRAPSVGRAQPDCGPHWRDSSNRPRDVGSKASYSKATPVKSEPKSSPKVKGAASSNPAVQLLKSKAALRKTIDDTIASASQKKSVSSRLKAQLSKLGDEQRQELAKQVDKDKLLSAISSKLNELDNLRASMADASKTAMLDIEPQVHQTIVELKGCCKEAEAFCEAASYLYGVESQEARRETLAKRYQRSKVQGKLVQGGFAPKFAKLVSERLQSVLRGEDSVAVDLAVANFEVPTVFTPTRTMGKVIVDAIGDYKAKCTSQLADKMVSLKGAMQENPA